MESVTSHDLCTAAPGQPTIVAGQFTRSLACPWCGHQGTLVWEETQAGQQVVSLNGFYERVGRKPPYDLETVCDKCDRTQPR